MINFDASLLDSIIHRTFPLCGVPCSVLWPWISNISDLDSRLRIASNEGEAVAYSAGIWLGGGFGVTFMQNSGLGNAINAISSLLHPYAIPTICIVGWRGMPGTDDEPQHRLMGSISESLLRLCAVGVINAIHYAGSEEDLKAEIHSLAEKRHSAALLLPPNKGLTKVHCTHKSQLPLPTRSEIVSDKPNNLRIQSKDLIRMCVDSIGPNTAIVATTGYCSRELFKAGDAPNRFYMAGSMGHAAALGLGIADQTKKTVVVLDGDGALLMRLGSLAMIAASSDIHIVHILLNNGLHESTGGQPVVGGGYVQFAPIAQSCGYTFIAQSHDIMTFQEFLHMSLNTRQIAFIEAFTSSRDNKNLPRLPNEFPELALRFRRNRLQATQN